MKGLTKQRDKAWYGCPITNIKQIYSRSHQKEQFENLISYTSMFIFIMFMDGSLCLLSAAFTEIGNNIFIYDRDALAIRCLWDIRMVKDGVNDDSAVVLLGLSSGNVPYNLLCLISINFVSIHNRDDALCKIKKFNLDCKIFGTWIIFSTMKL